MALKVDAREKVYKMVLILDLVLRLSDKVDARPIIHIKKAENMYSALAQVGRRPSKRLFDIR